MELRKEFMIDGKIVHEFTDIHQLNIYSHLSEDQSELYLYVCKNNTVIKTIKVSASMGQGQGFIDEYIIVQK